MIVFVFLVSQNGSRRNNRGVKLRKNRELCYVIFHNKIVRRLQFS